MLTGTPEYLAAHLHEMGAPVSVPGVESSSSLAMARISNHLAGLYSEVKVEPSPAPRMGRRLAGAFTFLHRQLQIFIA